MQKNTTIVQIEFLKGKYHIKIIHTIVDLPPKTS